MLAIPMVLEMLMESVFAVVDIFWVAHLGADAVATVGLTESMLTLLYAVAIGLGLGATAMVARRIGERNPEGAARAAVQAIALGLIVSIVVAIIGVFFADKLLALMGGSPWVLEHGAGFTKIMFAGNATILLFFLINAIFAAPVMPPLRCAFFGWQTASISYLDLASSFGLGPFPELGVAGAAVATTIGRGTGVLYALSKLIRSGGRFDIRRHHIKLETCHHGATSAPLFDGDVSGFHRNGELDRINEDCLEFRQRRFSRLYDRHPRPGLCATAFMGSVERRGYDGWPVAGSRKA